VTHVDRCNKPPPEPDGRHTDLQCQSWQHGGLGFGKIAYLRLLRRLGFRYLRSIVFDQMLPKISHYWRRETVESMMREQGLLDVRLIWVNEVSWSAIGTKPAVAMSS
jgi:hypothetical protein